MTVTRTKLVGNVKQHKAGSFWWVDLNTTDVAAAKKLFTDIMDWTYEDMPGGVDTYTVASRDGLKVVGMMPLRDAMREQGVPPFWLSYVTVDDIQASSKRAAELGGTVMMEPFQIEGAGWMAPIVDPTGAAFALWQPLAHTGADAVNGPGSLVWLALATSDMDTASAFYTKLFGWTAGAAEDEGTDGMLMFKLDGRPIASVSGLMDGMPQSVWSITLGVDDVDAALEHVTASGGAKLFGPHDTPWGRMLAVRDPQGAVINFCEMSAQSMD